MRMCCAIWGGERIYQGRGIEEMFGSIGIALSVLPGDTMMADQVVHTLQDAHLQTVVEVLQSIKASEMTPMLQRIYSSEGGSELLDVLMKYL